MMLTQAVLRNYKSWLVGARYKIVSHGEVLSCTGDADFEHMVQRSRFFFHYWQLKKNAKNCRLFMKYGD